MEDKRDSKSKDLPLLPPSVSAHCKNAKCHNETSPTTTNSLSNPTQLFSNTTLRTSQENIQTRVLKGTTGKDDKEKQLYRLNSIISIHLSSLIIIKKENEGPQDDKKNM